MLLAKRYNLFPGFFAENPTGLDLLLIDHTILNRCIDEENKAQEAAMKMRKERSDHPGMVRNEKPEDFWDSVDEANRGEDWPLFISMD
jgi:hypothetical protein